MKVKGSHFTRALVVGVACLAAALVITGIVSHWLAFAVVTHHYDESTKVLTTTRLALRGARLLCNRQTTRLSRGLGTSPRVEWRVRRLPADERTDLKALTGFRADLRPKPALYWTMVWDIIIPLWAVVVAVAAYPAGVAL